MVRCSNPITSVSADLLVLIFELLIESLKLGANKSVENLFPSRTETPGENKKLRALIMQHNCGLFSEITMLVHVADSITASVFEFFQLSLADAWRTRLSSANMQCCFSK